MALGTIGAVAYGFGYIFTLWPLIVLSPLKWKREDVPAGMIIAWSALLIGWLSAATLSPRPLVALIPEPVNTYLFFLTGLGLLAWVLLREMRRQRFLRAMASAHGGAAQVLDMSTRQFEDMTIELYRSLGYAAKRVGGGILLRGGKGGCWLVQCRGWQGPVGEDVVKEFWDEVQAREMDGGILITTGMFSRPAREWAEGKCLSLMEGEEFLDAWRQGQSD
jgi:hypothetical protein